MSGKEKLRAAINEALLHGGTVQLGNAVLCDICDGDWTDRTESGGFLFGSKAYCPDCAPEGLKRITGYGEERFIRGYCPGGVSFADWVRGLGGPERVVRVTPGFPGGTA